MSPPLPLSFPLTLAVLLCWSGAHGIPAQPSGAVAVRLLAFNDFHGNLQPPTGSNGLIGSTPAGGSEYLATHLIALGGGRPNTLIVSAGDAVGASPLLSSMFHDEPAIEALNEMGLDVSSVGNHEFDDGWRELLRKQNGGCHPADGCQDGTPFEGARFQYLAANVSFDSGKSDRSGTLLPAHTIRDVGGVRIGFIGLTLQATPQLVMRSAVEGLRFEPEVRATNKSVRVLKAQGVRTIVVLIHEGGVPVRDELNGCPGVSGPIVAIANGMSDDVDIIVSGHTHRAYNCTIDGKLVTSAASFGRVISAIDLTIDARTGDVASKKAENLIVTRDVAPDPAQSAIIAHYRPHYSAVADQVVGTISGTLARAPNGAGESVLGNIIADITLQAARAVFPDVSVSFMNAGGVRADLPGPAQSSPPRPVTYAEASSVLPFRNRIVVQTMTGRSIKEALEQQFDNGGPGQDRMLQVSAGFSYAYDRTAPASRRVDPRSIMLHGRRVLPKQRYRVAINEFIAAGGDNFKAFTSGREVTTIGMDLDIFAAHFRDHSPVGPVATDRTTRTR